MTGAYTSYRSLYHHSPGNWIGNLNTREELWITIGGGGGGGRVAKRRATIRDDWRSVVKALCPPMGEEE